MRFFRPWVTALFFLLFTVATARADSPVYDLDSLCFMSSDILAGQLLSAPDSLGIGLLRIDYSYKGHLKSRGMIGIADLNFYECPIAADRLTQRERNAPRDRYPQRQTVQRGDRLILFLERAEPAATLDKGKFAAPVYVPFPSGVRMVRRGRVFAFTPEKRYLTHWEPRTDLLPPYLLDGGRERVTSERFEEDIEFAIAASNGMRRHFADLRSDAQTPWLLRLVRARARIWVDGTTDQISEIACARIANLHDVALTNDALAMTVPAAWRAILGQGLACREGRDSLLLQIGNRATPLQARIDCAKMLADLGAFRDSVAMATITPGWRIRWMCAWERPVNVGTTGIPEHYGYGDDSYLARIVSLALDNQGSPELCLTLVNSGNTLMQEMDDVATGNANEDFQAARALMKELYDFTNVPSLHDAAGGALWLNDSALAPYGFKVDLIPLWVRPVGFDKSGNRFILFRYRARMAQPYKWSQPAIMLANEATGKEYAIVDNDWTKPTTSDNNGIDFGIVPSSVPSGKYRVFYRFAGVGQSAERTRDSDSFEVTF